MARKNRSEIFEDIGSVRNQINSESDSLQYDVLNPIQDIFQKIISYIEDQVTNLKDYVEYLKELCDDDVCRSYLDGQTDELNSIKTNLVSSLDGALQPIEDPNLNPMGYLTYFFKISSPILGDLMSRLNRTHALTDSIHDGLVE